MAIDLYGPCPCGSGKKFKWCCQPIHVSIDKAFRQDAEGQHEAALRIMEEVVREHPGNPETWGRQAQLLYQNDKVEEAEAALEKAFSVNPQYPFGFLLRGMFRHNESEIPGALLLFRKAADVYDPEAKDVLAQVYSLIADCELKMNRPVAARAALQIALHCQPADEQLLQNFEAAFGAQSRLPLAARKEYRFQPSATPLSGDRRVAWDRALQGGASSRLSDAVGPFEQLTRQDETDAAAWYNLGLVRAWLGDNRAALAALDRAVASGSDEARAADAWALAEVLRCGQGMEEVADYLEYSATFQIRDGQPLVQLLQQWEQERRMIPLQTAQEDQTFAALILEAPPVLTRGAPAAPMGKLGANLLLLGGFLRVWFVSKAALGRVQQEIQKRAGQGLTPPQERLSRINFGDVLAEALVFPIVPLDKEEVERRIQTQAERYFEESWIHRPLKSLNGVPPIDAVSDRLLRRKVIGVLQFLQDCAVVSLVGSYDFDRLRRKLGLLAGEPAVAGTEAAPGTDLTTLSAAELAAVPLADQNVQQLEEGFRAALKLDAPELAGRFAQALVGRPVEKENADRFTIYFHLIQRALQAGQTDEALNHVNEGERVDCESNEGRRRNEYELRRAQIHAKRGEVEEAERVFDRLIERDPAELRYRGSAAEAMLSLRQPARARRFAEQGLAKARAQNNRDSEQYFMELAGAAKKQEG